MTPIETVLSELEARISSVDTAVLWGRELKALTAVAKAAMRLAQSPGAKYGDIETHAAKEATHAALSALASPPPSLGEKGGAG